MWESGGAADPAPRAAGARERLSFARAAAAYVAGLDAGRRGRMRLLLDAFEDALGRPAPLLAYTPLTAQQWQGTLPPGMQAEAQAMLADFRTFLRDCGWLDAARPINLFD